MPGPFKKLQAEQQKAAAAAQSQAAAAASLFTAAFGRSRASPAALLDTAHCLLVPALKARGICALKRVPSGTPPLYQQRTRLACQLRTEPAPAAELTPLRSSADFKLLPNIDCKSKLEHRG